MSVFKRRRQEGWLAVAAGATHVDVVHVRRPPGGMPQVTLCASHGHDGTLAAGLGRVARELRLDRYRCTTVLARRDYQLHQLEAPNVPRAELKAAMRWRVKDVLEYPVESATVDVLDIPADPQAAAPAQVVYVVTARTDGVRSWVAPFDAARVPLAAVDIAELAQRNVAALFEEGGQGVAMLAFDDDGGLLTFTRGGELYSARRVEITLGQLAEANDAARAAYFDRIALEVQRSLDHLGRQYHYVPLAKVLLGPLAGGSELAEYLASVIDVPVELVDLTRVLDSTAAPVLDQPEMQARFLRPLGAALRDEATA